MFTNQEELAKCARIIMGRRISTGDLAINTNEIQINF